jgi:hypothetical protein
MRRPVETGPHPPSPPSHPSAGFGAASGTLAKGQDLPDPTRNTELDRDSANTCQGTMLHGGAAPTAPNGTRPRATAGTSPRTHRLASIGPRTIPFLVPPPPGVYCIGDIVITPIRFEPRDDGPSCSRERSCPRVFCGLRSATNRARTRGRVWCLRQSFTYALSPDGP